MKKRLSVTIGIATMLMIAMASPVLAQIDHPDTLTIDSVYAYQHCLEIDDQLYLIEYTIDYTGAYPGDYPDENVTEAWLARLLEVADAQLGVAAPYAYFQSGYGKGVVAIYFSEADAPALFDTPLYYIELTGNPTLDWGVSIPLTTAWTLDNWSSSTTISATQSELSSRVLYLADVLELSWEVDMVEATTLGNRLTTYGEDYFTNVFPNLRTMCPDVFAGGMEAAEFPRRDVSDTTYSDLLRDQWDGTWLDTGDTAALLGLDKIWITGILFMVSMLIVTYFVCQRVGSYKPMLLVVFALLPIGARLGFIPLLAPVIMAFLCGAFIVYALFFKHSSA